MINCNKIYSDKNCNIIIKEDFNSEYVYVYILQQTKSNGTINNQVLIKDTEDTQVIFSTKSDGFYTLVTLLVPLDETMPYYYKDGKFYKNIQEVNIQEIIEVNPEYSKINPIYDYYFQTCRLKKCYIKACQEIFNETAPLRCSSGKVNQDSIYKRDLIWATLNVIEYMTEFDQYEEAERLLEEVTDCNGICPQEYNKGCGCGR